MFEEIIKLLEEKKLPPLREARRRIEAVIEKVQDPKLKAELSLKYNQVLAQIDRVTLCLAILKIEVSVETSADFKIIKFPIPKEVLI